MKYKALVESMVSMKSATKGTPGLEFEVSIRGIEKSDGKFVECDPLQRRVWLWFPRNSDNELTLKKLRHAGWSGEPLGQLNLIGRWVEIDSTFEDYKGQRREKYEFALPPRPKTEADDDAFLAISAAMSSAPVPMPTESAPAPAAEAGRAADDNHSDDPLPF